MSGAGGRSGQRVRVVVVDDHPFFRDGLIHGLRRSGTIDVVGESGDGREGLALIRAEQPDVALLDYQMPGLDGLDLVRALARDESPTRALILSALTEGALVFQAIQAGASGYLAKDSRRSDIVEAVMQVARGRTVVPPELTEGLAEQVRLRATSSGPVLTERERQVLAGFARGRSIPQLADELYLAPSTVKTHTQRMYEKLGVSDRAAAVAEAMRRGLLE